MSSPESSPLTELSGGERLTAQFLELEGEMIESCEYNGRVLRFGTGNLAEGRNTFTVVVGKNGTGKSRLLRSLIENFVPSKDSMRQVQAGLLDPRQPEVVARFSPSRVIALSTSPFDKFPITREIDPDLNYSYLGLRGLGSQNLSLSFMSRTLWALLSAVREDRSQAEIIESALAYLGYDGRVEVRFSAVLSNAKLDKLLNAGPEEVYARRLTGEMRFDRFMHSLHGLNSEDANEVWEALIRWRQANRRPRLGLVLDRSGVHEADTGDAFDESWISLFRASFFTLHSVGLSKSGELIRINDASSGEQCVVMALLGIASHIRDRALICIDEPEICLHPEWQEKYVELLMETFSGFRECHFVIATHSPQVISRLDRNACFVLDIETGVTRSAAELKDRSADFQLARVFRAPGFRNEYLSRAAFAALRELGSGRPLSESQLAEVHQLLPLKSALRADDPVRSLVEILESALRELDGQ